MKITMSDAAAREIAGTIVVGIDGSPQSRRALRWALREARFRRAAVCALHAWEYPYIAASYTGDQVLEAEVLDRARAASAALIASEIGSLGPAADGVAIEQFVTEGPAASALLDAAEDAEIVVLGARGNGGYPGLPLGSVSDEVVRYARCPVVVVPTESIDQEEVGDVAVV